MMDFKIDTTPLVLFIHTQTHTDLIYHENDVEPGA